MLKYISFLLMLTAIWPKVGISQSIHSKFSVTGSIRDNNYNGMVQYNYDINDSIQKKGIAKITKGKFSIEGWIQQPVLINISLQKPGTSISFYLDTGHISLLLSVDSFLHDKNKIYRLNTVSVTGSTTEDDYQQFFTKITKIYTDEADDTIKAAQLFEVLLAFSKKIPQYYFPADVLCESDILSFEQAQLILEHFSPVQKKRADLRGVSKLLDRLFKTKPGAKYIYFEQADTAGKMVQLKNIGFKYLLVNFWASSCGPCRAEHPELIRLYNNNKAAGFEILGISLDYSKQKWADAVKIDQIPWADVSDLAGNNNKNAAYYSLSYIPFNFLVNDKMEIIDKNLTPAQLEKRLDQLFHHNDQRSVL